MRFSQELLVGVSVNSTLSASGQSPTRVLLRGQVRGEVVERDRLWRPVR